MPAARLPVLPSDPLDDIRIASPCAADWNGMRGDDRVRRCGDCKLDVFNLSAMTRAEAVALLRARAGRTCVRLYRRADGTVITADCGERLQAARRRGRIAFVAALVFIGFVHLVIKIGLAGLLVRLVAEGPPMMGAPPPPPTVMMGEPQVWQGQMIAPAPTTGVISASDRAR